MVNEIIERAALKVRVKMMDSFGYEMSKEESITLVRTTIEAMREPTEEMIERAIDIKGDHGWRSMIDEARK